MVTDCWSLNGQRNKREIFLTMRDASFNSKFMHIVGNLGSILFNPVLGSLGGGALNGIELCVDGMKWVFWDYDRRMAPAIPGMAQLRVFGSLYREVTQPTL